MNNFPYERIVQWSAGPISIIAGYLSVQLTTHVGLFGSLGITKDQTARAIVTVGTFGIGCLVTYAGHHKWLSNLPKWWDANIAQVISESVPQSTPDATTGDSEIVLPDKPESAITPDPPDTPLATKALV